MTPAAPQIAVIGAGVGGLAAALRLSHAGAEVTVFERHRDVGGKMRTTRSDAGPVDAGPTVLTMKHVFEALFAETGSRLSDHVTLSSEHLLARHFWPDGTRLDLTRDPAKNAANIEEVFGADAAEAFRAFDARARTLFEAFDAPMMQTPKPQLATLAAHVISQPSLALQMDGMRSLDASLRRQFKEPKLAQLFGRYATYVGGNPEAAPALLSLIWHAEAKGVWHVKGGMHALAQAIARRARELGCDFKFQAHVIKVAPQPEGRWQVETAEGRAHFDAVLYNGDPRALNQGMLGQDLRRAVPDAGCAPRSLSACVHSFAAKPEGVDLAGHNVFFCANPHREFGPLARGKMPSDATLYICAQDRFDGASPSDLERFEIIANAPPCDDEAPFSPQEQAACHSATLTRLADFGLTFSPTPEAQTLTMPQQFRALFPASNGSLYGRSPHGMMAAFKRPTVRSRMKGLYLVGGGVHPGAGVPMATLCARHAAEAISTDLSLTSPYRQADTPGGTSTASQTTGAEPSLSSPL